MMEPEKKNKHMTLEDRIEIQECLNKGMTFKAIASRISKDPTTVSKEVPLPILLNLLPSWVSFLSRHQKYVSRLNF